MVEVMESVDLIRKMKKFQEEKDKNPVFEVFRCYMQIIMVWIWYCSLNDDDDDDELQSDQGTSSYI